MKKIKYFFKNDKKEKSVIFVQVALMCILTLGATFALKYAYDTISASLTTANISVVYVGDQSLTATSFIPIEETDVLEDALTTTFTVKGAQSNPNIDIIYDVSLKDISIGDGLISEDFKWKLYKNGTLHSSGDFSGVGTINGNETQVYDRAVLTSEVQSLPKYSDVADSYTLYVYVLETGELQLDMMGQRFGATINIDTYTTKGGTTNRDRYTNLVSTFKPNAPILANGMIPVKYDGNDLVIADQTNEYDDWYSYQGKKWANAVMINENATNGVVNSKSRVEYMNSPAGTEILESDVLAYYVWIPRYKYKLFNAAFASVSPKSIDIIFESDTTPVSNGTCSGIYNTPTNNCYYTHPAFWWDNDSDGVRDAGEELAGIWVGKFEVSSDTTCTAANNSAVNSGCNNRGYKPRILPGVTSWRGAMTSTFYLASRKIEADTTYLTTAGKTQIDSHMMKNMEWGAVAYLSYSSYGKNSEITNNNNGETYYTGGGSGNTYKTSASQSTTGNITGIYDMSGNAFEYVMGVMKDNINGNPMSGYQLTNYYSGFNGKLYNTHTWSDYTGGVDFPDSKYYDLYNFGTTYLDQAAYNRSHIGDALGETRSWNSDNAPFVASNVPVFIRGGHYANNQLAGMFSFDRIYGSASTGISTRLTLTNK